MNLDRIRTCPGTMPSAFPVREAGLRTIGRTHVSQGNVATQATNPGYPLVLRAWLGKPMPMPITLWTMGVGWLLKPSLGKAGRGLVNIQETHDIKRLRILPLGCLGHPKVRSSGWKVNRRSTRNSNVVERNLCHRLPQVERQRQRQLAHQWKRARNHFLWVHQI